MPTVAKPKRRGTPRLGEYNGTEVRVLEANEPRAPESRCVGTIAMVTRDWVSASTTISWMMDDRSYMGPGEYNQRYIVQGNVLTHQRNDCIAKMDGDWILFIDSDMAFQPGAVTTLVETQRKFDLDIVGGLCFQRTPPFQPTLYVTAARKSSEPNIHNGYTFLEKWPEDAAVEVDATGMAFVLIHKRVFDRIMLANTGEHFPDLETRQRMALPPFFRWEGEWGEDFLFCREAKAAGNRIFVDTSVKVGHVGQTTITEEDFFREIAFRRPDEQEFREKQLMAVGHEAMTQEGARRKLGVTWF